MEEPTRIGEWRNIAQLGAGSFGIVTLWRNEVTNDCYAVKKCKMGMSSSLTPRQKERWKHEVTIMKQINNANIVGFKELPPDLHRELDKYNPTKLPLLSMEYCSKGNLRTYLKSWENMRGLEEIEVRYILLDICNAIEYLHGMDITHRDIKPENIVLQHCNERANKTIYKIIDLGYAKELATIVSFVGTLPYLAPEIFQTESYTKNVDYWSFGITAYEIITGELPFLPTLEPPQRFEYIKKKSDDDICIYISKNGTPIYSKEILKKGWISPILKKNIEGWLRLVLQFNPKKRGTFKNKPIDVISELKQILHKKIVRVLFVNDLSLHSYEVTNHSTFGDVKRLVLTEKFSLDELVVLYQGQTDLHYDSENILECINNINHETEFYIFSRKAYINIEKSIPFPKILEQVHKSRHDFSMQELWELAIHLLFYIRSSKYSLELFNKSIYAQIALTEHMFEVFLNTKLFERIRKDLNYLVAKIECYVELNNGFLCNSSNGKNEFLNNQRVLLRQTKELIENVNGMTEKFVQFSCMKNELTALMTHVKKILKENSFDSYLENVNSLRQRIQQNSQSSNYSMLQNNSNQAPIHFDLAKTLSQLLRVWRKNIIANSDISKLTLFSLNLQKSLKKHYKWCITLDKEIYRVTNEFRENHELICQQFATQQIVEKDSCISIAFPNDLSQGSSEADLLMQENMTLRYVIQDRLDETSDLLEKIQQEILGLYNGVSLRYRDI